MRAILVALLAFAALAAPASARAQSLPRVAGPLPSIGLPLPRITAPLAPIGLPPVDASLVRAGAPRGRAPRGHVHPGKAIYPWPSIVYLVPGLPVGAHATYPATTSPGYPERQAHKSRGSRQSGAVERGSGVLRLNVEPAALVQVYVDGFFAGTPADYDRRLRLDAGEHRIELQAPGYRPASFAVRIASGRSITYSTPLEPLAPAPSPGAAPSSPAGAIDAGPPLVPLETTVYMIPGCYLGNVPPEQVRLPETCDASKVTTYEP